MDKIVFQPEGEEAAVEFYVLEQTRIGGIDYILVTDTEDEDGEALILRDVSASGESEALYEIVTEEKELRAVAAVFESMLEDIDLS
ncbi:MAG: DUF1292 domain-containing protein [Blautia sp.]|nr:DUF1292 domain-containing protein [Lachnoclostridium sp.]MCM1211165.1 DUF1292 domain-containing protein [Blautia sp.]